MGLSAWRREESGVSPGRSRHCDRAVRPGVRNSTAANLPTTGRTIPRRRASEAPGRRQTRTSRVTRLLRKVAAYEEFTPDNDPHQEHDFGAFGDASERFFWKIDYYDLNLNLHSPDPTDPERTRRVLTLMLDSEY